MIRRFMLAAMVFGLTAVPLSVKSYDTGLAASYARLFEPAVGAQTGKALHLMPAKALVEKIQAGEPLMFLDVRTPGETRVFAGTLPGTLTIPLNELFEEENLQRLPTDRPVVVLCQSCVRAALAATGLRHIGFDKVFILKGGYKALVNYLDAGTANPGVSKAGP